MVLNYPRLFFIASSTNTICGFLSTTKLQNVHIFKNTYQYNLYI